MRRRYVITVLILIVVATLAHAAAASQDIRGIDTPRCKELIAAIVEKTGATYDHASPSGDDVFLSHPAARSFSLDCRHYARLSVFAGYGGAFPPNDFFDLLATAGAIFTKEKESTLNMAIHRCHRSALESNDQQEELDLPHAEIDCQSFLRDGGGTTITVATGHDDPVD